ncbi:MAG: hypothetical protein WC301_06155 [Candidatus Omnitrophota bacterium]
MHLFDFIVFRDDYPYRFAFLTRGLEILKQGALFGWDSKLLGGYPTFFDINENFSFIYYPFSIFGIKTGFHLMILFFWLFFPFIIYAFISEAFKDRKAASLSLYISLIFNWGFLKDLFDYGMMDVYAAVNLFIAALFFALRFKEGKKGGLAFLLLCLFLLIYAHISIFIFGLIFVSLELLFPLKKVNLRNFNLLIILLFLATLNYTFYLFAYSSFFNPHTLLYKEGLYPLAYFLPHGLDMSLFNSRNCDILSYTNICLISVPFLAWFIFKKNPLRKYSIYILFIMIIFRVQFYPEGIDNLFHRGEFLLPFLLTVVFSLSAKASFEKRNFVFLFFIPAVLMNILYPVYPIRHIRDIRDYNPALISRIEMMREGPIFLESRPHLIQPTPEKCREEVHFEALISQDLGKALLSYPLDGYHYSVFRNSALQGGIFMGKPLSETGIYQFNDFLDKWGVKYMVVWSNIAREYLGNLPEFYLKEWEDEEWAVFQYRFARPQKGLRLLQNRGMGELKDSDYFLKTMKLSGVNKDDIVVLKTNYFPAWKAFYKDKEVPVFDYDGQLAIKAPFDGDGTVIFRYPRYYFLSLLILIAFACAVLIDWRASRKKGTD